MRHKCAGVFGLMLAVVLLAGCWDRSELNELSITSATGLDRAKDQWVVSYQVIIPSAISGSGTMGGGGGASGQAPVVVHSVTSRTVREAAALSHLETPRRLYIGHNSVLVISEKAAREGIEPIIDVYLRNHETRETVSVMVSSGEARNILEQLMSIERIPGQGLQRLLEKEQRNLSYMTNVRLYEIAMDMVGESKTSVVPEIIVSGKGEITQADKLKSTTQTAKLKLGRLAVIHENKMIGWLSQEEALGTAFLRDRVEGSSIPFSCEGKSEQKDATYVIKKAKTQITPKLEGDTFSISAKIKAEGMLTEINCPQDLVKPEVIKQLEGQISKEIERSVRTAWEAAGRLNADVFGISSILNRSYPDQWEKLKKEKKPDWKEVKLTVKADVMLKQVGLSNKSFTKMTGD